MPSGFVVKLLFSRMLSWSTEFLRRIQLGLYLDLSSISESWLWKIHHFAFLRTHQTRRKDGFPRETTFGPGKSFLSKLLDACIDESVGQPRRHQRYQHSANIPRYWYQDGRPHLDATILGYDQGEFAPQPSANHKNRALDASHPFHSASAQVWKGQHVVYVKQGKLKEK
jgi:hypothetical protein